MTDHDDDDELNTALDHYRRFGDIYSKLCLEAAGNPLMTISQFLSELDRNDPDPDFGQEQPQ